MERGGTTLLVQQVAAGQFAGRLEDPSRNHAQHQAAKTRVFGSDQSRQALWVHHAENHGDMTMSFVAEDIKDVSDVCHDFSASQQQLEIGHDVGTEWGHIG